MIDLRAIRRYAQALFNLARERGELETIQKDFLRVRELVQRHREIGNLVSNSTIALAEKEDFLEKVVPADLSKLLLNFLKVLIKKKRFIEILSIQEAFYQLYEKERGIREVVATSAAGLSERAEEKLRSILKQKWNVEIRLVTK